MWSSSFELKDCLHCICICIAAHVVTHKMLLELTWIGLQGSSELSPTSMPAWNWQERPAQEFRTVSAISSPPSLPSAVHKHPSIHNALPKHLVAFRDQTWRTTLPIPCANFAPRSISTLENSMRCQEILLDGILAAAQG